MDNTNLLKSSKEIALEIASKVKKQRKILKITQEEMANRIGVSLSKYRKFEKTGEININALIDIGFILDEVDAFSDLFNKQTYKDIEEVIRLNA